MLSSPDATGPFPETELSPEPLTMRERGISTDLTDEEIESRLRTFWAECGGALGFGGFGAFQRQLSSGLLSHVEQRQRGKLYTAPRSRFNDTFMLIRDLLIGDREAYDPAIMHVNEKHGKLTHNPLFYTDNTSKRPDRMSTVKVGYRQHFLYVLYTIVIEGLHSVEHNHRTPTREEMESLYLKLMRIGYDIGMRYDDERSAASVRDYESFLRFGEEYEQTQWRTGDTPREIAASVQSRFEQFFQYSVPFLTGDMAVAENAYDTRGEPTGARQAVKW